MLKVGLLCGVIAAMSAAGISLQNSDFESKDCDSRFIVELKDDIDSISREEAIKRQDSIFNVIRGRVNKNSELLTHYSVLSNAFVVSANKDDFDAISSLQGVKSVTEDVEHVVTKSTGSSGLSFTIKSEGGGTSGDSMIQNESAITMLKPTSGTNEGEGTLIAILDNEFYFRNKAFDENGVQIPGTPFHHEVYTDLDSSTKIKLGYSDVTKFSNEKLTHARQANTNISRDEEGSLYFSRKVPFYFDYAGDSTNGNSEQAKSNYDVSSDVGLHGSHVSSIAGANAPTYKGIAPKAQLACMKVFSDVFPTEVGEVTKNSKYSVFSELGFIQALEDAYTIGADVVNVSIGSDLDDFDLSSFSMKVLNKLTNGGVMTSISAGNGGKSSYAFAGGYGNWTRDMVEPGVLGSFANEESVMTIASGQPENIYYECGIQIGEGEDADNIAYDDQVINREGQKKEYQDDEIRKFYDVFKDKWPEQEKFEYVYVGGFGQEADYKDKDVENKVAVVNRGSTDFADKYRTAKDHQAAALLIINNDPTSMDFNFRCDFGGEKPKIPVALVLFKDKQVFAKNPEGEFIFISEKVAANKAARTISDFSSDGSRFDLDLKPEITTPGTNVRGAVWPQNEKEKLTPLAAYEYMNGTSMAAPNYAGASALVVSKKAKEAVKDSKITEAEEKDLVEYRKSMPMRFMSTAIPMNDYETNGENGAISVTSPRMQGAGMANIGGAYNTDVYLKGTDVDGTVLNKSKILLRNGEDIAKGDIKLNFVAHNEGNLTRKYNVSYSIMRPATIEANKIVPHDYNYSGEVSDINLIPGLTRAVLRGGVYNMETNSGTGTFKDVINVTRELEYYTSVADAQNKTNVQKFEMGYYYFSKNNKWEPLPNNLYQSTKDVILETVNCGEIEVKPGDNEIHLDKHSLSQAAKDKIAKLYPYGTYIEGYVTLRGKEGAIDLSIPYMGFYSLTDKDSSMSFETAPVAEPFSFEKNKTQIYGSDLVNDITKQLLGKDKVNFESLWVAGYAKTMDDIDVNKIVTNDENLTTLKGFHSVGTIPGTENEYTENPQENIYVGNPKSTNTMIIQQFMMRSVKENYFTIVNKSTGKEVYRSALQDMLFGAQRGHNVLYKSHVDSDYLSGGYVAHRAYSIIPLYDPLTKVPFASGDYEIKFNYQLATSSNWVSKAYTLHIDSEAPVVNSIAEYKANGKDMVRISFKDTRAAYANVGTFKFDCQYDKKNDLYYVEVEKSVIAREIQSIGSSSLSNKRLFVSVTDYAYGTTTAVLHFENEDDYTHFQVLQGYGLTINHDFEYKDGVLKVISIDKYGRETEVSFNNDMLITNGKPKSQLPVILGASIGGAAGLGALVGLFFFLKKKKIIDFKKIKIGGKKHE